GGREREEIGVNTPYNVFGSSGSDTSGPPGAFGSTGVKPSFGGGRGGPGGGRGGPGGGRGRGRGGPPGGPGGDAARRMGPGGAARPVPPSLHAPWKPPASSTSGEGGGEGESAPPT